MLLHVLAARASAADILLSSQDGLAIGFDEATGRVTRLELDGQDWADPSIRGGFFVRDRQRLAEVPTGASLLLPNRSFETDNPPDGMPDFWSFEDSWLRGATLSYGSDAFDGTRSVTINTFAGGQVYTQDVPVTAGDRYVIQAMHKGTSQVTLYVVWKSVTGDYLLYDPGVYAASSSTWAPLVDVFVAPAGAAFADIGFVSTSDGDLTLDLARMYLAPPEAWTAIAASVTATPTGARASADLTALGLRFDATLEARAGRIDIEARLTDTTGSDRALDAGLVLPVLARTFWDAADSSRMVTQQTYSESFAYTWWGGIYNDGRLGEDRSIYPFQAVGLGSDAGVALAYDVERGPQDLRFYHSTFAGDSFTARIRLGLAPEPRGFPREGRFRLSLYRVDGRAGFRSALERYYREWPQVFARRIPGVGGWTPSVRPAEVPGIGDFGVDLHTWDDDVGGDDSLGVTTFGYVPSWEYWLPLGDFTVEPTPTEARVRLDDNATRPGVDPTLQRDARAVKVSGLHDPSGRQMLQVYQAGWMPGSGWSAVCGIDPDPEVSDRSGNGWASRYRLFKDDLDARFARAQGAGAALDGAFFDWFSSWHRDAYNHRRSQLETCDVSPSWDPATLGPAIWEPMSHWDATAAITQEMRSQGRFTMARDIHFPSFWATALLDAMSEELDWDSGEEAEETLSYFRAVAGAKPYSLLISGDLVATDFGHLLRRLLPLGLLPTPGWDSAGGNHYFRQSALYERDRPLFRRFVPLYRLEQQAGWQPMTHATVGEPAVRLERWGAPRRGTLLFAAWNSGPTTAAITLSVDLAALGIAASEVGRVVDLVEAGVRPTSVAGGRLEVDDTLAPDAARLYHVHLGGAAPLVLFAVKRGADVALDWTDAARPLYELLRSPQRDFSGASVELVTSPSSSDRGVVGTPGLDYYSVE